MLKGEPAAEQCIVIDGVNYGIPHGRGANLLMWRTDVVKQAPDSWGVVFDPSSPYKGKVTAYDSPIYIADAALYLKATKPDMLCRVLVVTALLKAAEMERARSYGICGIVSKPFEIETLLEAVKQCAGDIDGGRLTNVFCSSTPMILLLADLLRCAGRL